MSYVDFTITFEGDENQSIDDVDSGVEAINGGLGIAVTKSSGMVDNRTISAITPVDENTSDVRFTVYIGRTARQGHPKAEARARSSADEVIRQFSQDVHIWSHQRYSDPPALAPLGARGLHRDSQWAQQFYPDGRGGSAAELRSARNRSQLTTERLN